LVNHNINDSSQMNLLLKPQSLQGIILLRLMLEKAFVHLLPSSLMMMSSEGMKIFKPFVHFFSNTTHLFVLVILILDCRFTGQSLRPTIPYFQKVDFKVDTESNESCASLKVSPLQPKEGMNFGSSHSLKKNYKPFRNKIGGVKLISIQLQVQSSSYLLLKMTPKLSPSQPRQDSCRRERSICTRR